MATTIEWTDETWNPTRGCRKISAGCKHCYAETFAQRFEGVAGHAYELGFKPRTVPDRLDAPLHWTRPRQVFVNSMSDLFLEDFSDEYIAAVFGVMAASPQHTFQILTKRAGRMRRWFEWAEKRGHQGARLFPDDDLPWRIRQMVHVEARRAGVDLNADKRQNHGGPWPLPNVWLGVSVEDQANACERIPDLLNTPAAVHFISAEPLLGPVDLTSLAISPVCTECGEQPLANALDATERCACCVENPSEPVAWARLDQVIAGGESGNKARPTHPAWSRTLRDDCVRYEVAFFFKQWGNWLPVIRVDAMAEERGYTFGAADLVASRYADTERAVAAVDALGKFMPAHFEASGLVVDDVTMTPSSWYVANVGKKAAGRELDGRTWDEMPRIAIGGAP